MERILESKDTCSKDYSCAASLLIIMKTGMRVGNEDSAEGYYSGLTYGDTAGELVHTYGLTTVLARHVRFKGNFAYFSFVGKKQVRNVFVLPKDLSSYVKEIKECKKPTLFGITDYELTKFVKDKVGDQFTTKDFRTMRANIYAWEAIKKYKSKKFETKKEAKEVINEVADFVSQRLNNTPGVVKKSYINPILFQEITGYLP
jgi:DNA topoisomerase IB